MSTDLHVAAGEADGPDGKVSGQSRLPDEASANDGPREAEVHASGPTWVILPGVGEQAPARKKYEHIILLCHGIRDKGEWFYDLKKWLEQNADGVLVSPVLGREVSAAQLVTQEDYWDYAAEPAAGLAKQIRSIRRWRADIPISVFAHSFGTYVVHKLLDEDEDDEFHFHRLALAGSVLNRRINWDRVAAKVGPRDNSLKLDHIVNFIGDEDNWPTWAKRMNGFMGDIGSLGAGNVHVTDCCVRGGHSLYGGQDFVEKVLKPFLLRGVVPESSSKPRAGGSKKTLVALVLGALIVVATIANGLWNRTSDAPTDKAGDVTTNETNKVINHGAAKVALPDTPTRLPFDPITYAKFVELAASKSRDTLMADYSNKCSVRWKGQIDSVETAASKEHYVISPISDDPVAFDLRCAVRLLTGHVRTSWDPAGLKSKVKVEVEGDLLVGPNDLYLNRATVTQLP